MKKLKNKKFHLKKFDNGKIAKNKDTDFLLMKIMLKTR